MALEDYIFSRSSDEATRLNEQHVIWSKTCGYLVHPNVSRSLPLNARIADIATGTGAWALDATKMFPNAIIDAFDISSKQFPNEARPANVTFSIHDIRDRFDPSLYGQYDLVHIRAIGAGMSENDWSLAVANLVPLLRPGGAIQWAEADLAPLRVLRGSDACAIYKYLPDLIRRWNFALSQRGPGGPLQLPDLMKNVGGLEVDVDTVSSDRIAEHRADVTLNYVVAILGWAAADNPNNFGDSDQHIFQRIKEEVAAGAYLRTNVYTIIARRAVDIEVN